MHNKKGQAMLLHLIRSFSYYVCKNDKGAAGVEYALLITLAALAIIGGTVGMAGKIQAAFQSVNNALP